VCALNEQQFHKTSSGKIQRARMKLEWSGGRYRQQPHISDSDIEESLPHLFFAQEWIPYNIRTSRHDCPTVLVISVGLSQGVGEEVQRYLCAHGLIALHATCDEMAAMDLTKMRHNLNLGGLITRTVLCLFGSNGKCRPGMALDAGC